MTNYSELESKTISYLRFPLMMMIVFIHNPHPKITMQGIDYLNLSVNNIYSIIVTLGHYTLTSIAVPGFFMFSGFLFFYKTSSFTKQDYINKLKKRLYTLVIPYFIWNIISVSVKIIYEMNHGGSYYYNKLVNQGVLSIFWNYSSWTSKLSNQMFYGPGALELWFLRDLIITILLSPAIYYLIKHTKYFGVIGLGLMCYFKLGFELLNYNLNQPLAASFYFALGAYYSINAKNMIFEFRRLKNISLILSSTLLITSVYFYGGTIYKFINLFYVIFGIITLVNITSFLIEKNHIKENNLLSKASFFIYLTHPILILKYSKQITNYVLPFNDDLFNIIKYVLTPFVCTAICVSLYWLLNKSLPRFTSFITGGR